MTLVESTAKVLKGYSQLTSPEVKKLVANQALQIVLSEYLLGFVPLAQISPELKRPAAVIIKEMQDYDQVWRAAVEYAKPHLSEEDYAFLLDQFRATMVTCEKDLWQQAFPHYRPIPR